MDQLLTLLWILVPQSVVTELLLYVILSLNICLFTRSRMFSVGFWIHQGCSFLHIVLVNWEAPVWRHHNYSAVCWWFGYVNLICIRRSISWEVSLGCVLLVEVCWSVRWTGRFALCPLLCGCCTIVLSCWQGSWAWKQGCWLACQFRFQHSPVDSQTFRGSSEWICGSFALKQDSSGILSWCTLCTSMWRFPDTEHTGGITYILSGPGIPQYPSG